MTSGARPVLLFLLWSGMILPSAAYCGEAGSRDTVSQTLLNRPLFEPDRRPKDMPEKIQGGLRLSGIVGRPDHWAAIFHPEKTDGKSEIRTQGQMIENWTVSAITRNRVTLTRDSETREMKPAFLSDRVPTIGAPQPDAEPPKLKLLATKRTDPHLAW